MEIGRIRRTRAMQILAYAATIKRASGTCMVIKRASGTCMVFIVPAWMSNIWGPLPNFKMYTVCVCMPNTNTKDQDTLRFELYYIILYHMILQYYVQYAITLLGILYYIILYHIILYYIISYHIIEQCPRIRKSCWVKL